MLITRSDLDRQRCSEPGCTCDAAEGIFLQSLCHPHMPLWAMYKDGELVLTCSECDAEVIRVPVAG